MHEPGAATPFGIEVKQIGFIPCSQSEWIKKYVKITPELEPIQKYGICIDNKEIHLFEKDGSKAWIHLDIFACEENCDYKLNSRYCLFVVKYIGL